MAVRAPDRHNSPPRQPIDRRAGRGARQGPCGGCDQRGACGGGRRANTAAAGGRRGRSAGQRRPRARDAGTHAVACPPLPPFPSRWPKRGQPVSSFPCRPHPGDGGRGRPGLAPVPPPPHTHTCTHISAVQLAPSASVPAPALLSLTPRCPCAGVAVPMPEASYCQQVWECVLQLAAGEHRRAHRCIACIGAQPSRIPCLSRFSD